MEKNIEKNIDKNRRNFLKILLFGGGAIVLGKVLGPTISKLIDGPSTETNFQNFKTVENKKGLTIFDKTGEEIFEIDNGASE
ncbi:MAG: hypothetical protein NT161_02350 [Candidatus Nomurabacteria bacterium]|nr:hypothetical protein [Candidatus Nomurabacteria bacterium]